MMGDTSRHKSKIMDRCCSIEDLIDKVQGLTAELSQRLSDAIVPVGTSGVSGMSGSSGVSGMSGYSSPPTPLLQRLDSIHFKAGLSAHQLKQLIERIDI